MNRCHYAILKKSIFLMLAFLLGVTPILAQTNSKEGQPYLEEKEVKKVDNVQLYQEAMAFLNTLDSNAYKTWNHPFYMLTPQQEDEMRTYLNDFIIKGMSDEYEKAKAIFNWVHNNVSYAYDLSKAYLHPYDIFKYRSAVCGGYSNLYKALLNLAGIAAVNVSGILTSVGETAGHEWNAIYVDGRWMYADATWGNEHFNNESLFSNQYKTMGIYQATQKVDDMVIGFDEGVALVGVEPTTMNVTVPKEYKGLAIRSISDQFFLSAYEVRQLQVPDTIRTIKVATGANKLESIIVDEANPYYVSREDALFTKDYSQILLYPKNRKATKFTIPAKTTEYDFKQTFDNVYLETILVEEGNSKFQSYDGAVYSKGYQELYTVPYGTKQIRIKGGSKMVEYGLSSREKLEKVVLEDGITTIPQGAFAYCSSLKEVEIPASVKAIDEQAFDQVNISTLVIKGYKNSVAEQFANDHGISFVTLKEEIVAPTLENIALLEADIQTAKEKNVKDFTDESVMLFQQAVKQAEEDLLRYKKQEGSNEECLQSIQDLQAAYGLLVIKPVRLVSYSISMKGNIALNLYMEIQPEVLDDEQAYFIFASENKKEQKVWLNDMEVQTTQDKTLYKVEIPMVAKEMNDFVSSTAFYKDMKSKELKEIKLKDVKIQDYANKILKAEDSAFKKGTKEAVISMLNYGASAQIYFNYKKDQLVNEILSADQKMIVVNKEDLDLYKPIYSGDINGLSYLGSSVLVQSDNTISHYFKISDSAHIDDYKFTRNNELLVPTFAKNAYYIEINNIFAKNLGKSDIVMISDGQQVTTIEYSVLSYAYIVLNGEYPSELQDLVKSLYAYHLAAKAYAQQ